MPTKIPFLSRAILLKLDASGIRRAIFCLLLALSLSAAATAPTLPPVDPTRYLDDIKTLAAPNMEGRGAGTKGLGRATKFIEDRYKSLGLRPAGTNGYLQPFTVTTGAKLKSHNQFIVEEAGKKQSLTLNQDFVPVSFSSSGSVTAPVVFAGYGASADEFGYDDYAGLDVKDKIVVVLRYEPEVFGVKSGQHGLTQHSQLITKAINARNHGAKALIVVNGKLADGEDDLLMRFGGVSGPQDVGIMLLQVKNTVAENWFKAADKSLPDVQQQINHLGKPDSFAFPDDAATVAEGRYRGDARAGEQRSRISSGQERRIRHHRRALRSPRAWRFEFTGAVADWADPSWGRRQRLGNRGRAGTRAPVCAA